MEKLRTQELARIPHPNEDGPWDQAPKVQSLDVSVTIGADQLKTFWYQSETHEVMAMKSIAEDYDCLGILLSIAFKRVVPCLLKKHDAFWDLDLKACNLRPPLLSKFTLESPE